ncbi:MAG: type II/IV secretion system protein, partial [Candidatus Sumerlaeia bacterium]|nr:type II/IV secretion system protein [Candidatus Sumerlaeia bacterium]
GYSTASHDNAVILADRARSLRASGNEDAIRAAVVESIVFFRMATDAATGEERYAQLGEENEQRLAAEFADLFDEPEEEVVEDTSPRSFSEFFQGDILDNFLSLFRDGGILHDNADMIVGVVATIGGFIVFWWVIPSLFLGWVSKRGNVVAAELRLRVKALGPITLGLFIIRNTSFKRKDKKVAAENACPHCGFRLDNPKDYPGFIFSKCPKCEGTIKPVHTLEKYLQSIADGLSSDVERVNKGAESMERFIGRESVGLLLNGVITLGIRRRASDLHFEPGLDSLVIRQRIDGMMTEMIQLPRSLSAAMVSAIKVESSLNIAEKRVPQDGKMTKLVDNVDIDIRVATSPSGSGEKASLRLLDIRSIQMDTRHLGMMPEDQKRFDRAIEAPHGLILVSGPTGSGKTTTLYVALQKLKSGSKNIISIEDPIEFQIPGMTQMQVNVSQGLTFASGLRSILRQDPDIIMVGEIRDHETAEISVNSALTGHLVLSTLHTIDSSASVARLIDLGVSPRQFADALNLVIAQRLVRLVCSKCSTDTTPDPALLEQIGLSEADLDNYIFRKGTGCTVCNQTGFYRRSGVFEFLEPSERLRVALEKESLTTGEIREIAIQSGMKSLRTSALEYLARGLVTLDEVVRVTK